MKDYYFDDNEVSSGFIKKFTESDETITITYGNNEKVITKNTAETKKAIIDIMESQIKEAGSKIKTIATFKNDNLRNTILFTLGAIAASVFAIGLSTILIKIILAVGGSLLLGCAAVNGIKCAKYNSLEKDYYKNRFFLENQEIINSLPMFDDEVKQEEMTINDLDRYKYGNLQVMRDNAKRLGKIRKRINTNKKEM